jgi:hypothetical protein
MRNKNTPANTVIALSAVGSAFIGVAGFIAALFPFFEGDHLAAAAYLLASAVAFGLLANAVWRS